MYCESKMKKVLQSCHLSVLAYFSAFFWHQDKLSSMYRGYKIWLSPISQKHSNKSSLKCIMPIRRKLFRSVCVENILSAFQR